MNSIFAVDKLPKYKRFNLLNSNIDWLSTGKNKVFENLYKFSKNIKSNINNEIINYI